MKSEYRVHTILSIVLGSLLTSPVSGAPQRSDRTIERLPGFVEAEPEPRQEVVETASDAASRSSLGPPRSLPPRTPRVAQLPIRTSMNSTSNAQPQHLPHAERLSPSLLGPPRGIALTPTVTSATAPNQAQTPGMVSPTRVQSHGAALVKMMPPAFAARSTTVAASPFNPRVATRQSIHGVSYGIDLSDPLGNDSEQDEITNDIMDLVTQARQDPSLQKQHVVRMSIGELISRALANSKNIEILRLRPIEFRQTVGAEYGRFDWTAFVENRLLQGKVPVQNSIEVSGSQPVIRQEELEVRWGVRKNTKVGGTLELGDSVSLQDDNSGILQPPDQGISRFTLNYQQELLRNAGKDINLSPALIASYQADSVHANSVADISTQIQAVVDQYWLLFEARGRYFVWQSLVTWAEDILEALEERKHIDAQENLISQARALQLEAQAEAAQARIEILIAQDRLRRLINDPTLESDHLEIIPIELPDIAQPTRLLPDQMSVAMQNRGEIRQALSEIQVAATRHNVSVNQLLPRLTFVLESSLNGLDGGNDIGRARINAFDHEPLLQAELNLEFFLGNRRAKSLVRQADIAMARLRVNYEDEVEGVKLDVREALRTLNGSNKILDLRYRTLDQRAKELDFLRYRYRVIPEEGASTSLQIEEYFLALNRLVASQLEYFRSLVEQQQALINLLRAKGLLVRSVDVPYNAKPPVPNVHEAYYQQLQNKPAVLHEEHRAVIKPNLVPY